MDKISCYDYHFVQNFKPEQSDDWELKKLFAFKSSKNHRKYLVWVEKYSSNVYIIKFHLKSHTNSKTKYNIMTNLFEARPIVNTCMFILYDIAQDDENSSFGFIGARMENEGRANTKRYRFYSRITSTYFSEQKFTHYYNEENSTYLLLRNTVLEANPNLVNDIQNSFSEIYENII